MKGVTFRRCVICDKPITGITWSVRPQSEKIPLCQKHLPSSTWANKKIRALKEPLFSGKITLDEYKQLVLNQEVKP
jgi:hypothetical protein